MGVQRLNERSALRISSAHTFGKIIKMILTISIHILLLVVPRIIGGVDFEEICIKSKQNSDPSEGMVCTQMPIDELPSTVTAIKVEGEIRILRKSLFGPNKHLEKLNLSTCNVSEIEFQALSYLRDLKVLLLSNNSIDIITDDDFSGLNFLQELYLDGNGMKVIMEDSFKHLKNLKILNLANNNLLEMPGELPSSLVELNVMNNEIEILSMEKIQNLIQLQVFQVCGNDIHNWPEGDIFPALRTLCLGDKVTISTTNTSSLSKLQNLKLSARKLNNSRIGQALVERISKLTTLQSIELENYEIKSFGFLINMSYLNSVTLLNINYTSCTIHPFPSNLISLTINGSPSLTNSLLRTTDFFLRIKTLSLKNNEIKVINHNQSEHLMASLESLKLSSNPLNCTSSEEWTWLFKKIKQNREFLVDKENVVCHEPNYRKNETLFQVLEQMGYTNSIAHEINTPHFKVNVMKSGEQDVGNNNVFYSYIIFLSSAIPYALLVTIISGILYNKKLRKTRQNDVRAQYVNHKNRSSGNIFIFSEGVQDSYINRDDKLSQDSSQQSSKTKYNDPNVNRSQT